MTISEAIEAANKIIRAFPNGGNGAGQGYIGALAATLGSYPKSVALRCADPVRGVTRDCRFLPTVADIVGWCERETAPLYRQAASAVRIAEQLELREQERPSAESCARVEAMKLDCLQRISSGPSVADIEAKERKDVEFRKRRLAEVRREWDGEAPTIAGIPVSAELVASMRRAAE